VEGKRVVAIARRGKSSRETYPTGVTHSYTRREKPTGRGNFEVRERGREVIVFGRSPKRESVGQPLGMDRVAQ